jgi:hypothetical protein
MAGARSPTEAEDVSSNLCVQNGTGAHPASCTMGTGGSLLSGKTGRGVMLTTHSLLVPRLRKSRSYTSSHPEAPLSSKTGQLYLFTSCCNILLVDLHDNGKKLKRNQNKWWNNRKTLKPYIFWKYCCEVPFMRVLWLYPCRTRCCTCTLWRRNGQRQLHWRWRHQPSQKMLGLRRHGGRQYSNLTTCIVSLTAVTDSRELTRLERQRYRNWRTHNLSTLTLELEEHLKVTTLELSQNAQHLYNSSWKFFRPLRGSEVRSVSGR